MLEGRSINREQFIQRFKNDRERKALNEYNEYREYRDNDYIDYHMRLLEKYGKQTYREVI